MVGEAQTTETEFRRSVAALVLGLSAVLGIGIAAALAWLDPGWEWKWLAAAFAGGFLVTRPFRGTLGLALRVPRILSASLGPLLPAVVASVLWLLRPEWFTAKRLVFAAVLAAVVLLGVLGEFKERYRWFALPGFGVAFVVTGAILNDSWTLFLGWSLGIVCVLAGIAAVDLVGKRLAAWLSPRLPWEAFVLLGAIVVGLAVFVDWGEERRERKAILPVSNGAVAYLRLARGGHVSVDSVLRIEQNGKKVIRRQQLISGVKPDSSLAWAPGGRRLAFVRETGGTSHIWTYDFFTRQATRVTAAPGRYADPAWSTDGRLAYSEGPEGNEDIYVSSASRHAKAKRLTNNRSSDVEPTWSPDGDEIAFASDRTGQYDIYVIGSDGKRVARLTRGPRYSAPDRQPAWSPNGRTIAFVSRTAGGRRADIYLVDATGRGEVTNLTRRAAASSTDPAWSPDATEIAFTRMNTGRRTVFRVTVQGPSDDDFGHTELLEGAAVPSFAPAWKPFPDPRMPAHRYPRKPRYLPRELAQRYAPLVRLHKREKYWPMAAFTFIRMSRLEWRGCGEHAAFEEPPLTRKLGGGQRPGDTADAYSVDRSECPRGGTAFVHDRTRPKDSDSEGFVLVPRNVKEPVGQAPTREGNSARSFIPESVPVYFEHVPGRSLTYWMFYGFSALEPAGRLGKHQGDWERITVCLDPEQRPVSVVYHRHNTNRARSWAQVPKFGTHPIVFSAQGSHAAYPSAGTNPVLGTYDRRDEGPIWATWRSVSNILYQRWYGYGGSWGKSPGPDGPSRFKVGDEGC